MASIIRSEKSQSHIVEKYSLKPINSHQAKFHSQEDAQEDALEHEGELHENENALEHTEHLEHSEIDASALSKSSKDALIESLMKKTDDMSSNFIKLQMKLESKEEEYALNLEKAKETSYQEGLNAGLQQAAKEYEEQQSNIISQFSQSVNTLNEKAKEFEKGLEEIKAELVAAAFDIAKEVINVELEQKSSEIATILGDALIKDLQGASKITLKVNPKDHAVVSEKIGSLENVSVISDSAISVGGVVAISDSGNLDSQISKRFEKVKRAALSE